MLSFLVKLFCGWCSKKTDHDVEQKFKKIGNVARYEETRTCNECHRGRREKYAHRGDMPKH